MSDGVFKNDTRTAPNNSERHHCPDACKRQGKGPEQTHVPSDTRVMARALIPPPGPSLVSGGSKRGCGFIHEVNSVQCSGLNCPCQSRPDDGGA